MPHLRYGPLPASKTLPVHWPARRETPGGPQFPVCVRKGLGFSQSQLNPSVGFPFVPARWTFVFSLGVGSGWAPVSRRCHKQTNITNKLEAVANFRSSHLRVCCTAADQILRVFHQSCWPRGSWGDKSWSWFVCSFLLLSLCSPVSLLLVLGPTEDVWPARRGGVQSRNDCIMGTGRCMRSQRVELCRSCISRRMNPPDGNMSSSRTAGIERRNVRRWWKASARPLRGSAGAGLGALSRGTAGWTVGSLSVVNGDWVRYCSLLCMCNCGRIVRGLFWLLPGADPRLDRQYTV